MTYPITLVRDKSVKADDNHLGFDRIVLLAERVSRTMTSHYPAKKAGPDVPINETVPHEISYSDYEYLCAADGGFWTLAADEIDSVFHHYTVVGLDP